MKCTKALKAPCTYWHTQDCWTYSALHAWANISPMYLSTGPTPFLESLLTFFTRLGNNCWKHWDKSKTYTQRNKNCGHSRIQLVITIKHQGKMKEVWRGKDSNAKWPCQVIRRHRKHLSFKNHWKTSTKYSIQQLWNTDSFHQHMKLFQK